MHTVAKILLGGAVAAGLGAAGFAAIAQPDPKVGVTVNDPVGPLPNPAQVPIVLLKDIKCRVSPGKQEMCILYGDPEKPGPYTIMYKWYPGNFSKPHFHNNDRWGYVASGTWWVSSSSVYDERTTYPVRAGNMAVDKINAIHWDGNRAGEKEPAVVILSGVGPNTTIYVDENGKPKPPAN
ncbi:MAG TPA: cupin domain-containing protein [Rhizomicrobium sp.]|nr:cupin domain-containing protein [Rhizomicrobium sp.]